MRLILGLCGVVLSSGVAFAQSPYGSGSQPYTPAQQPGYYGQPASQPSLRNGLTGELNLGLGWIHASNDNASDTSDLSIAGLSLGLGGWLNDHLVIGGRIAGVTFSKNGGRFTDGYFGPVVQYWVDDHIWFGGGIGLGFLYVADDQGNSDSISGLSFDLRGGYTFNTGSENTFNVSFELNPGHYSRNGSSANYTGIGFLLGYQHL